jgi:hemerythrin-like metal-binding protein
MGKMVWKDEYSVGNELLDAQHRGLLDLVNRLDGDEPLDRVLKELAGYADTHFRDEERLIEAAGFPDLAQQKTQHNAFRAWLDHNLNSYRSGGAASVARRDLYAYLSVWIANHLMVYDAAFKPWLEKPAASLGR